jgi:outer membrane receptor protein involved in Fe transport
MRFKFNPIQAAILACLIPATSYADTSTENLAPVIVTADLRETSEQDIPASVSVQTQADLQDQGATHFDDILLKTPNVNFSGQSSRARHIQIRGMGERDEYTGAPNSSVGFAIDDIDFSGIGMVSNLFDVKQVEVLRGPQNTRYGQSAIAGLINIQTNDPTAYRESMVEASTGQDNLKELGIMTSGPFSSKENAPQYRISLFKHTSDGFRTNDTLNRTDTNGRDELNLRAKFRFTPNKDTQVDVSLIHADLNNGYDAWSRDNSFTTLSDQPGKDTQLSNAGSIKVVSKANPNYVLTSKTSLANSDMDYNYDIDWLADSANEISSYNSQKHRRNYAQELRWTSTDKSTIFNHSTDWVLGLYASHLEETNHSIESYDYPSYSEIYNTEAKSNFSNNKLAAYTQLDQHINSKTTLSYSLRIENNDKRFNETRNMTGNYLDHLSDEFSPNETLWGAAIQYSYRYNDKHTAFAGVTKGFKAGGFNTGIATSTNKDYVAESLLNYEVGLKSNYAQYGLKTATTFFYMDRKNPQFDGYLFENGYYAFFTENFDSATNYGLETEFNWQASANFNLYGSAGLLQTDVTGTPLNSTFEISDREQAHAPNYQFNLGAKYRGANGVYAQADITALDKFYFDNVNSAESNAYHIINARIGYENKDYEIYLWGKNLTDETYATRGYYFDFNPPYDNPSKYERLGDPRQLGVTARVYF